MSVFGAFAHLPYLDTVCIRKGTVFILTATALIKLYLTNNSHKTDAL